MSDLKESDWKHYKSMLDDLRERYLKQKNSEFIEMLSEQNKTATDQFWDTLKEMKEETKILNDCLGRLSRSSMYFQMMSMCSHGMMEKEDLDKFSEELQGKLKEYLKA